MHRHSVGNMLHLYFELSFTWYANITPASTCRNDYALTFQNSAVFKFHFNKFFFSKRFARCRFITSMSYSFTCSSRLATSLYLQSFHADEVLNAHSIHYLTTEALSNDTSADAFTCRVNCRDLHQQGHQQQEHRMDLYQKALMHPDRYPF